jgi:hypothetical protein
MTFAQIRKTIAAALGVACILVTTIPTDVIPDQWRPWVGIILGLGTVAGVYQTRNVQPSQKAADEVFGPRRKLRDG